MDPDFWNTLWIVFVNELFPFSPLPIIFWCFYGFVLDLYHCQYEHRINLGTKYLKPLLAFSLNSARIRH